MSNTTERQALYLAALLSDIGLFLLRAYPEEQTKLVSGNTEGMEQSPFVPGASLFLQRHEQKFRQVLGSEYDLVWEAIATETSDNNKLRQLVQQARQLATGSQKMSKSGLQKIAETRLACLFEGLMQQNSREILYRMPVAAFTLENGMFPEPQGAFSSAPDYRSLWDEFEAAFTTLTAAEPDEFSASLLDLLHLYTITVPGSLEPDTDISLYDHLKSTAALALCLYDWKQHAEQTDSENTPEQPLLLVGADISGIQSYIYDIVGTDAAKNLKGRSFYLQLLSDTVLQRLLDSLQLPQANVVYASGGGFYVLAPNTSQAREKVEALRQELGKYLFKEYRTSLFLALGFVALSEQDIYQRTLNERWRDLTQQLNEQKRQRFRQQLTTDYDLFFEPASVGGVLRDVITNEEITPEEEKQGRRGVRYLKDEKDKPVKAATYQQIELGKQLRKADYAAMTIDTELQIGQQEGLEPLELGYRHYFFNEEKLQQLARKLPIDTNLRAINIAMAGKANIGLRPGLMLYGGNRFPAHENEEPKLFDELAQGTSLTRLGYLRMDVDNLGQVFVRGIPDQKRTFARYSALSRMLDYFFKGYLNTIWNSTPEYRNNTFILYSGGDDLFIIGRWDCIISLAARIREEFGRWVCQNPALGLSGGIAMVGDSFPVAKAAQMAEVAEKQAKSHTANGKEKDALSLLGYPLAWQGELELVRDLKTTLAQLINDNELPRSILSKIGSLFAMMQEQKAKQRTESWRWLIAYDFARARQRLRSEEGKQFLDSVKNAVFSEEYNGRRLSSSYSFLELLQVAARWAELEIRK